MSVLSPGQFYHASDTPLDPGAEIMPAHELARARGQRTSATMANSDPEGMVGSPDHAYATTSLSEAATWGRHVYPVQPLGKVEPDPDGISDNDYRSQGHLRVMPHTPATQSATDTNIAKTRASRNAMSARHPGVAGWWTEPVD